MPNGSGPLDFDALLRTQDFESGIKRIESQILGLTTRTQKEANKIDDTFRKLGGVVSGYFAFNELAGLAKNIVNVRGEFQQLEIAFTTMLKSKTKADALMQEITKAAAETPFDLKDIAQGAKQLLAYGSSANKVVGEIKMLGDVASGVSAPIGDLIYLYGTLRTQGRAYATDIQQFAGRGIPIYEELAKVLKINTSEVRGFVESGKVGFKEVEQAFKNMTGAGGMFSGLMAAQSKSLTGLIANFGDAVARMFNDLGKSQEGTIAEIIKGATTIVDNYEEVVKILKVLVITYGAYKAAVIATSVIQASSGIASSISSFISLARSIKTAADAQALFNLVTGLNPYVVIATAIVAATVAVISYADNTTSAELAQRNLAKAEEESKKQKEELTKTTNDLISAIRNETATRFQQLEAFEKLKEMYPSLYKEMDIDTYKKQEAIQAQKDLNKVLDEISVSEAEDQYRKAIVKVQELTEKLEKLKKEADDSNIIEIASTITDLQAARIEIEEINKKVKQQKDLYYDANTPLEEQITHYQKIVSNLEETKRKLENTFSPLNTINKETTVIDHLLRQLSIQGLIGQLNDANIKLNQLQNKAKGEKESFAIGLANAVDTKDIKKLIGLQTLAITENQIDDLAKAVKQIKSDLKINSSDYKQLDVLYNKITSKNKKTDDIAPVGSLSYWEKISKKADELIKKINPFDKSKQPQLAKLQQQKLEADKKAEEAGKLISIQTFDQTLEEKKKLYENYSQWIALKGQESADKDFAGLLKSGKSYQDFLQREIATLEAKITAGTADNKDRENLLKLKSEDVRIFETGLEEKKKQYELYNAWITAYNQKSADDQFKDLLQQGKQYTDYLDNQIKALEEKINAGAGTPEDKTRLVKLKTTFYYETNGLDKYKKGLNDAADKLGSLTERLEFFRKEQEKLGGVKDERSAFVAGNIVETEKQRIDLLKNFIIENNISEAKRLEIANKYKDLRLQVDKEYNDKKSDAYKKTIEKIDLMERDDYENLDNKLKAQTTKIQSELASILNETSEKQIQSFITKTAEKLNDLDKLRQAGKKLTDTEIQAYITLTNAISQAKIALNEVSIAKYQKLLSLLAQIGAEFDGIEGKIGEIGRALSLAANKGLEFLDVAKLSNTAKEAGKAAKSLKELSDNQPTAENIKAAEDAMTGFKQATKSTETAIAQLGITIVKEIVKSWIQQKKLNDELNKSRINYQRQYNALLLEEIRLNSIRNEGFVKNYKSIINDALQAGLGAQQQLNEVLYTIDHTLGVILKHHTGFLGIGAFDDLGPLTKLNPELIKTTDGVKSLNIEVAELLINSGTLSQDAIDLLKNGIELQKIANDAASQIDDVVNDLVGDIGNTLRDALVNAFHSGIDAAEAFRKVVGDVIADVSSKLLFSAIFQDAFAELSADFKKSFGVGGDMSIADDLDKWFTKYQQLPQIFEQGQKDLEKWLKDRGYDITKMTGSDSSSNSLAGAIKGMTQEQAGVLEGQFNALRITGAQHLEVSKASLDVSRNILLGISKIAVNSDYLKNLENIAKDIRSMKNSNDLRAGGLGDG